MSLGQKAEHAAVAATLECIVQVTATKTFGSGIVLAEHIIEVGLCEHTRLARLQRYVYGHRTACHGGNVRVAVGPYIHSVINGALYAGFEAHGQELACAVVCNHYVKETARVAHIYSTLRGQWVLPALHCHRYLRKQSGCAQQHTYYI